MRRRQFITLIGGAAAGWPLVAHAQERMRRVGVLMHTTPDEPESQARITALAQGLQEAGWAVGRNLRIDVRWSGGDIGRLRKDAAELVALGSDVLVAGVGPTTGALLQATRTVPIVFAQGLDPVGNGFVASMSRPGGNATGFNQFEYGLSAKWLELLREIAPQVSRVGVVRDLEGPAGVGQWAVIQAFASPMGVELSPLNIHVMGDTERAVSAFASGPNGGLIVGVSVPATIQRELIVGLAARYRLPTVYPYRFFVEAGGLISFGPNLVDLYRQAASYVDRIPPEQALSRADALRCATTNGAYLTFDEDKKGSLEPGKLADLAVLSADPLTVAQDGLAEIRALLTIAGGRTVHETPNWLE